MKNLGEIVWIGSRIAVVAAVLVWAGGMGWHTWKQSEYFRIQDIRFEGDIPARLPATVPIKKGQGLFSFDTDKLETNAKRRFVELRDVSFRRTFGREIVVRGRFRQPVAVLASASSPTGIDAFGVAFPIPPGETPLQPLPAIEAVVQERANAVACLGAWERKLPAFFDMVKKLECDRMRAFRIELSDGVVIDWGPLLLDDVVERARKILRLREHFLPHKAPARLTFVTEDRIVMDAAWRPAAGTTREGDKIVKG